MSVKNLKIDFIQQFHLELVGGCQLKCVGCPTPNINKKVEFIDLDCLAKCLQNVDVDIVQNFRLFNYGEPLLHPYIAEVGRVIRDHASFIYNNLEISTNAQISELKDFEAFAKQGMLTTLAVSCDGDGTPESYERLRPPAKWSRLMKFLLKAVEIRERYCPHLKIITRTIINSTDDKARWTEVLEPLDITPQFRKWKWLPDATNNLTGRSISPGKGVCFFVGQEKRLFVDHLGRVVPCCIHPFAGYFGSLTHSTFSENLRSQSRTDFISRMNQDRLSMSVCGQCEFGSIENPGPSAGD
jgi:MoaA/NifB/PqqE/SkfB family radical SAM enzyme